MYKFLIWIEKERGDIALVIAISVLFLIVFPAIIIAAIELIILTGGWIFLAILIAPAWVAWMFYCYITRERDQ